ncbi:MAG TPA: glycogen-binding domain-containing protein [Kofleriaceae bacterium]|nr:glycogen-binding domain-containing protein [Kofleriaceae bacterium]
MRCLVVVLLLAACRPPGYGKEPPPDADEVADAPPGAADAALDAPPAATCEHAFRLDGYATASSVWLTGDFVGWAGDPSSGAIAFTLGNEGAWTGSYAFTAGAHQYKLIIDGTDWILDPTNPDTVDDGMGHTNNVYTCVP